MRIGLDPEVALVNKNTGAAMSAHKFINEKETYTFRYDNGGGGMPGSEAERDGAAVEVRSIVASACRDNIIPYVAEALRQQSLKLEDTFPDFELSSAPVYVLDKGELKGAPKDVSEFGCRPDMDAYALQVKDPQCPKGDLRRYTGGHIHYSTMGAKQDIEQQAALAILFDYFVAMPMVAILGEKFADGEAERRQFYGQPGSFRYDDGLDKIEFRTLSGRVLLHPTLMYWVLGAMKSMRSATKTGYVNGRAMTDYVSFLKENIIPSIAPDQVHEIVSNHDVESAIRLSLEVFKLMPTYRKDKNALSNPMSGGGAGTTNPYFFEQSFKVFVEAHEADVFWDDNMQFNWGLYENYEPKHHAYWGIQQAMVGLCDDDIFPMNKVLGKVWPKDIIQSKPIYTHPLNGGAKKYVTPGAAGWLA